MGMNLLDPPIIPPAYDKLPEILVNFLKLS